MSLCFRLFVHGIHINKSAAYGNRTIVWFAFLILKSSMVAKASEGMGTFLILALKNIEL